MPLASVSQLLGLQACSTTSGSIDPPPPSFENSLTEHAEYHEQSTLQERSHQPSGVLEGLLEVVFELNPEGLVRFS